MTKLVRILATIALATPLIVGAQGMDMSGAGNETKIGGFADVLYRSQRESGTAGFDFGGVDLFITSRIQKKLSFLAEIMLERGPDGTIGPDIERVSAAYTFNNYFRLAAGRFHTPLGYWNSAYHHGALMQPTIDRPEIAHFEDDNGLLPMHTIGAMISGRDIGKLHLGYDVSLGSQLEPGGAVKGNPSSGLTMAVNAEPIPDVKIGASVFSDTHHKGITTQTGGVLGENVNELIGSGYAAYTRGKLEVIAEGHRIANKSASVGTINSWGGYLYAGVHVGSFVPYAMYEGADANAADLFLESRMTRNSLVGIREELSANAVVKFELRQVRLPTGRMRGEFASQFAIGF